MNTRSVTLIQGDGISFELTEAIIKIFETAKVNINWDIQPAGQLVIETEGNPLPSRVIDSIKKNKIALKTPITTPIGTGFRSVNVELRKKLNLYANLRPCHNLPNIKTRYDNVDIIIVRENTEDLYAGIERQIDKNRAESIKVITKEASLKIAEFAFQYALKNGRKEVCTVTKANICKLTDGLFLESAREIAKKYSQIKHREILVDNCCMQLVQNPNQFDILLLPNLYGDIISDLCAGLVGGLGIAQGANFGEQCAIFEPVHGSAPDIAGKNIVNPTAIILSSIEMLNYLREFDSANKIKLALIKTLSDNIKTIDIGGTASCSDFVNSIISRY